MSDFAEGLISAIAGGVQGGAEATGQIYEDQRKNATRIETETQLTQAQAEIQLQKQKALAEFTEAQRREGKKADFEQAGNDLPETLRRTGLIEAEKTNAEKAKWNDPEYRKARSLEEGITNPDRGAALRAEQTKSAKLSNEQAQMLVDKRNAWMNEPDQTKKVKLGEEYQTLTGKDPDKFAPVMGKDDAGNPVFLGSFDTKNNRFTSASELSGGASNLVNQKAAPAVDEVRNGYKFKGGNPNAKENWERVQQPQPKVQKAEVDTDTLTQQTAYASQQKSVADNKASLIAKYNRDMENVKSIKDPKARNQAIANLQDGARKSGIVN